MRKPSFDLYMLAAVAWLMLVQTPFMILVGNGWLLANLPRNVGLLCALYAIFIPHVVAGMAFLVARRRHAKRLSKEAPHA